MYPRAISLAAGSVTCTVQYSCQRLREITNFNASASMAEPMEDPSAAAGAGDGDGGDEASGSSLGSDEEWVTDSEDDEGGGGAGGGGGGGGGLPGTDALAAILAGGPLNQGGILAAQAAMAAMFQGFVHPSVSAQEGKNQTEWERIREDAQWAPGKNEGADVE